MQCKKCGSMNIDGAKVCESCGVSMEDVNMKQNQNDTGTKISNTGPVFRRSTMKVPTF